jgi:hypothetical protein
MLELIIKIILIPIILVILLVMVYVTYLLISELWQIVIVYSFAAWALFALPVGILLILTSVETVNTGLILVGSSLASSLMLSIGFIIEQNNAG